MIDISDAFKLVDVAPAERRFLAAEIFNRYYLWGVCVFGCASAPLVWGRLAALLMRLLQGLFHGCEARLNMYVDDILLQLAGSPEERTRAMAVALLCLAVMGFPVALHKIEFGTLRILLPRAKVFMQLHQALTAFSEEINYGAPPWSDRYDQAWRKWFKERKPELPAKLGKLTEPAPAPEYRRRNRNRDVLQPGKRERP